MARAKLVIYRPIANAVAVKFAMRKVTDTTRRTLNQAIVDTPVDKGRLRLGNKMSVRQVGLQSKGRVFNRVKYADAVHGGFGAYTIRPKRKKALKFTMHGETVIVRKVNMPAREGRPWLTGALIKVAGREGYRITL